MDALEEGHDGTGEKLGGHAHMITKHVARALNDAQRKRWIALLLDCADDPHGHRRFGGWGEVKGPYVP